MKVVFCKLSCLFMTIMLLTDYSFAYIPKPSQVPVAILVQLRVEQSRITALNEYHQTDKLKTLMADKEKVNAAMMNDFTDNFSFCPVYYYMDTNYEAVKNKKFDGILLDAAGKPVNNPVIHTGSSNYLVVCYGKPATQSTFDDIVDDSVAYMNDSGTPACDALVISDDQLRQVSFLYKLDFDELFIKRKFSKKYYYKSKVFKLEYYPFAALLNKQLTSNPERIHIRRIWR